MITALIHGSARCAFLSRTNTRAIISASIPSSADCKYKWTLSEKLCVLESVSALLALRLLVNGRNSFVMCVPISGTMSNGNGKKRKNRHNQVPAISGIGLIFSKKVAVEICMFPNLLKSMEVTTIELYFSCAS